MLGWAPQRGHRGLGEKARSRKDISSESKIRSLP